jgi:hypothetical protein
VVGFGGQVVAGYLDPLVRLFGGAATARTWTPGHVPVANLITDLSSTPDPTRVEIRLVKKERLG